MDTRTDVMGLAVPVALGLGVFATIVLTDGTEDLSGVRFLLAALAFFTVSGGSAFAIRRFTRHDTEKRGKSRD
ncbi:hypothetical protein [Streptomyces gardneri]|uniref:hypothetical protein n=1 Tax=Streptomyces gardneri TaxID=66892 RepID=UPI0035E39CFF